MKTEVPLVIGFAESIEVIHFVIYKNQQYNTRFQKLVKKLMHDVNRKHICLTKVETMT